MNDDTRSSFAALALVFGLTLLVLGAILFATSLPISRNEAIEKAVRDARGPKGEKKYEITDEEVRQAVSQQQAMNVRREGRRQISKAMAVAGIILLGARGLTARAPATRDDRNSEQ